MCIKLKLLQGLHQIISSDNFKWNIFCWKEAHKPMHNMFLSQKTDVPGIIREVSWNPIDSKDLQKPFPVGLWELVMYVYQASCQVQFVATVSCLWVPSIWIKCDCDDSPNPIDQQWEHICTCFKVIMCLHQSFFSWSCNVAEVVIIHKTIKPNMTPKTDWKLF
jgi:hypothetical protein